MKRTKPQAERTAQRKPEQLTFTNSVGEKFALLPMNPLESQVIRDAVNAEWIADGRALPVRPHIVTKNAAGEIFRVELKTRDDADTEELRAAWDTYTADQNQLEAEYSNRFLLSCFLCVDADPADYPGFVRRMKVLNIPMPEDETDRFLLFCKTWVVRGEVDALDLLFACSRTIATVSEEAIDAAEAMFRSKLETKYANQRNKAQSG